MKIVKRYYDEGDYANYHEEVFSLDFNSTQYSLDEIRKESVKKIMQNQKVKKYNYEGFFLTEEGNVCQVFYEQKGVGYTLCIVIVEETILCIGNEKFVLTPTQSN